MLFLRKIIVVLLFAMPLLAISQYNENIEDDDEFIEWTPQRLTWSDYKAKPSASSDAAAITSTALGMEYHVRSNTLTFKITCRFSKKRSWGRHKTEYILLHEQGHFDITEIFARKLAKELRAYKFNSKKFQDDLNKIYTKVMEDKEKFQNQYDDETDYSRNKIMQAEWLKIIQKELEALEEWADHY